MGFGGDTDLVNTGCGMGYGKGVFVRLRIGHLIPSGRCTDEYFLKSAEARGYSGVLHGFLDEGTARPPRQDSTIASSSGAVGSSASGIGAAKARRIASRVKGIPEQS